MRAPLESDYVHNGRSNFRKWKYAYCKSGSIINSLIRNENCSVFLETISEMSVSFSTELDDVSHRKCIDSVACFTPEIYDLSIRISTAIALSRIAIVSHFRSSYLAIVHMVESERVPRKFMARMIITRIYGVPSTSGGSSSGMWFPIRQNGMHFFIHRPAIRQCALWRCNWEGRC